MANLFDQFDEKPTSGVNVFDKFDDSKTVSAQSPDWFTKHFPFADADLQAYEQDKQRSEANRETAVKAIKATPDSAYRFAENIYNAVRHPIDTGTALYKTAKGGVQKLTGGGEEEKNFDQMVEFFKERYGGEEKLRKTIETDPVGFLADLSSVMTGAGGAVRGAAAATAKTGATAAKVAVPVSAAGRALSEAGAAVDPLSMVTSGAVNVLGGAVPKGGRLSPEGMLESTMFKYQTALPKDERMSRVATALENTIMPNKAGLDKVRDLIGKIDDTVMDTVIEGAHRGDRINTYNVVQHLDKLKKWVSETIDPEPYLEKINKIEETFIKLNGHDMPVDVAHRMKRNTYKELEGLYDQFSKNIGKEAKKSIARGLKEEVYTLYPELRELGKKEGALIALEESVEKAANRISNLDFLGIGVPIKGGAGAAIAGPEGAMAMTIAGILDTPQVKTRLAHALYKARSGVKPLKGTSTRGTAFQAGRLEEETD